MAARVAHRIERRHHQTGAVADDPNLAVELHEAEPERARLLLGFLIRRDLLELRELRLAEERVVVDVELRVAGEHRAVLLHEQRIDLDERRVRLTVDAVQPPCDVGHGIALRGRNARVEHERARLEGKQPEERARPAARDGVRAGRRHLLYVHATDRREHHHGPAPIAVERDPEVELARDVGGPLHVHVLDAQSFYLHAEDRRRGALRFRGRFRHLDAAGLAASARVHLRLHGDWRGDGLRCGLRFFWRRGETTVRNGDARAREDLLRLIFVDFHWAGRT